MDLSYLGRIDLIYLNLNNKMKNIKLYCITNKPLPYLEKFDYYLSAVSEQEFSSQYLRCDNGDNIFEKEKYYSELTFQYWYWKNKLNLNDNNWIGFCQKRRFWIKKNSLNQKIDKTNFYNHALIDVPEDWTNYDAIICNPIHVNRVKKIKMIKRGLKSIVKKPEIFFNESKQSLAFHFDMHHGYGNLDKAINLIDVEDKNEFLNFVNTSTFYNPHLMFITKPQIMNRWFSALFPWLFRCENVFGFKKLKGYDTQRLYAYLAERYLSFWFNKYTKALSWPWALIDLN